MLWMDYEKWLKFHAEWYAMRYRTDGAFRVAESKRKASWYAEKASDPAWLAKQAEKKRLQRAAKKKITKKKS